MKLNVILKGLACIFAGSLIINTSVAQEDCASAVTVTDLTGVVCATSLAGTVNDIGSGGCEEGVIDTWYSFVAQGPSADITVSSTIPGWRPEYVVAESSDNTCAGAFTAVNCVDQNGNYQTITATTTGLIIGNTYWIIVSSNGDLTTGTLSVCVDNPVPAPSCATTSDDCAAPVLNAAATSSQDCTNSCNTGNASGPDFTGNNCFDFPNATAWFQVTSGAADAQLQIDITSADLTNPYYTIFTPTGCVTSLWTIVECFDNGAGGSITGTSIIDPNTTYIIAVSDENGLEGDFTFCAEFIPDASLCNTDDDLVESASSDPATPVGGPYSPGEIVDFCYTINQYMKEECNWLQGISPSFGDCWDPASFNADGSPVTVTDALDVAGNETGTWSWWADGTVQYNVGHPLAGQNSGAGWYFVCSTCVASGTDPDDTFGDGSAGGAQACDPAGNGYTWTVCFQLIAGPTSNCSNGTTDCGMTFNTMGDGEIGAWGNNGCNGDIDFDYNAGFLCCVSPVITPIADYAICSGISINEPLTSDQDPGVTYTWTVVAGANISGHADGSGALINQTLMNSGTVSETAVYTVTADNGSCTSTEIFTITVDPIPTVNDPLDEALCEGVSTTAVNFTGNMVGTSYDWVNDNTTIGLVALGSGDIASFVATNGGAIAEVANITVTPTNAGCVGTPQTFVITVNPVPVLTITDPAGVCSPTSVDLTAPAVTAGSTNVLSLNYYDTDGITPLASPNAVAVSGTYYIEAVNGSCTDMEPVVVSVAITPVLSITDPAGVCTPTTVDLTAPAVTAGSTNVSSLNYYDTDGITPLASPNAVSVSGTYYIEAVNGSCTDMEPVVVTITTSPILTITDPVGVCSPATVDITAPAVTAGSSNVLSLNYYDTDGITPLASPNAVSVSGTYFIEAVNGSCTDMEPVVVSVAVTPVLSITDPAGVCTSTTVDLTAPAVTAGSTNVSSLNYYDTDGITPLASPNAVAVSGTYYIEAVNGSCTDMEPVVVTITTSPVLNITDPAGVCSPSTVDITVPAVTAGSTNVLSLNYYDTDGITPLASPNAVAVSGTYYIEAVNGSCTDMEPVVVSVAITPVLSITDPVGVCSPATVDITAPAVTAGSTNVSSLNYYDTDGITPLASPNAVSVSGTYYIEAVNGSCTDMEPVVVTITTSPILTITDPVGVCSPATVDITAPAVTAGSSNVLSLNYYDTDGITPLASPNAVSVSGTYFIEAVNGSCTDMEPVVVSVAVTPVLSITDPAGVCTPTTVDLTAPAVTAGSTNVSSLNYYDTDGITPLASPNAVAVSGTYYIEAVNGSCTDMEPVVVTITTSPILTITDPAGVCSPATVDLTVPAVTAGSTNVLSLNYYDTDGITPLASPNAVSVSGTYYIEAVNGSCTDMEPVVVSVAITPVLSITDPAGVCSPATVDITAPAVTAGSSNVLSLNYYDTDGITPLASPNAVSVSGTYFIEAVNGPCTDMEPVVVSVAITPVLSITDPVGVCSPATVDITAPAVTAGSTNVSSLNYYDTDGITPLASPNAISVSGTYYIEAVNGSCTDMEPVVVTVTTSPVLTITDPAGVCSPATVDITAPAVTAGSTNVSGLNYYDTDGITPLATPNAITVDGIYYIEAVNGSCIDMEQVTVVINSLPVVDAGIDQSVCEGASVTLTGAGGVSYVWDNGVTDGVAFIPAVGTISYTVTGTDGNGCQNSDIVDVTVNQLPLAIANAGNPYCEYDNMSLIEEGGSAVSWSWTSDESAVFSDASAQNPGVTNAVDGEMFFVSITDANGCSSSTDATIEIRPTPVAPIAGTDTTYCSGTTVENMTVSGTGGIYTWYSDASLNNEIGTGSTLIPSNTSSATYYVTETVNGCEGPASAVVITIEFCDIIIPTAFTPDSDPNNTWQIQDLDVVYPNNVVTIYNRWGNLIYSHESDPANPYSLNPWDGTYNGEQLPVASYYFIIEFNNGTDDAATGTVTIVRN